MIAFSARPAIVLTSAPIDDTLFMRLGMHLAAGRWLGHYNELTLAKGPGFPAFLALANLLGLPFPLALALFHAACAGFAAAVFGRLAGSRWLGLAVLAALLLAPTFYDADLMRVFRDFFYMSLCVAFVAAATALVTGCFGEPGPMAALAGVLGAWAWLTREEGVWLAPFVLVLLLAPLLRPQAMAERGPAGLGGRSRALAPAGLALLVGLGLVAAVGLANRADYGRFVVNEIKDPAFQAAMSALQDASAPFHREGVPVPAAARARIYAASPAFASLKEPVLDGPLQADATQWGCQENPRFCGDFGGGWFLWALRGSAAAQGWHESPAKAAAFYRRLAAEVRQACADGRLTCRHWPVPLAPPMRAGELADVAASFGKVFHVFTFGAPVQPQPRPSDLTGPGASAMLAFLDVPGAPGAGRRRVAGWYIAPDERWLTAQPGDGVRLAEFTRADSPDLVAHFKDPRLSRRRFVFTAECPAQACPVTLALDGGGTVPLDLATLSPGPRPVAGGRLYIEDVGGDRRPPLLKTRFSHAWLAAEARLPLLFRALMFLGGAAWLGLMACALVRRRLSTGLIVATALLASVLARMLILALTDALAFTAASDNYSLPGMALLVVFSVLALHEAAGAMPARRARAPTTAAVADAPTPRRVIA